MTYKGSERSLIDAAPRIRIAFLEDPGVPEEELIDSP